MKRIARWSTIFLLLCSIIWAGTASAAMIVENNMGALNTLNTINKNQTPQGKDSALERLAKEIGAGIWDNTDWDDPAFQENIGRFGITVLKKDTQPPEAFIGDAIFDHLGDTEFNAPEMNGNLLVLGGLNANLPSGKIDRLYVLSDEDVRLNIGAAAEVQELILGASGNVSLNHRGGQADESRYRDCDEPREPDGCPAADGRYCAESGQERACAGAAAAYGQRAEGGEENQPDRALPPC